MRRKYKRVGFTAAQSAELWERWQQGEGLKSIGRGHRQKRTLQLTNAKFIGQAIEKELFDSSFLGGRDFSP